MLLALTLLSPVLMATLVTAAVRIERRLDAPSGADRRRPRPGQPVRQHRRLIPGLVRTVPTDRREGRHREPGRLGPAVPGAGLDAPDEPANRTYRPGSLWWRRKHPHVARHARGQVLADGLGLPG